MAYCTVAELTDRYSQSFLVQLSDRADTPAVGIDTGLFDRAIADADALIDGYLKTRYALPLASTPPIVKDISQRVAIYNAHGQTVADKIRDDYKLALGQLKEHRVAYSDDLFCLGLMIAEVLVAYRSWSL